MNKVAVYHCNSIEKIPHRIQSIIDSLGAEKVSNLFRDEKVLLKPDPKS